MEKMISKKIKSLIVLTGNNYTELAKAFGMSPQSMHNKMSRGSFSAEDLIKIANFTGTKLAFVDPDTQHIIELGEDCIRE